MNIGKFLRLGSALLLVLMLALVGCGKKDNPFEPVTDAAQGVVTSNVINVGAIAITPSGGALLSDLKPDTAGVQGEIIITFPVYMEASTVNLTNIEVEGITTGTLTYYPDLKKAVIYGNWSTNIAWYKITLKTGLRGKGGQTLDGNGNSEYDGTPYDNHITYFRVGGMPTIPAPDLVHPKLTSVFPTTGFITINNPGFYAAFDARDLDSQLVRNNFTVRDSTGRAIALKSGGTIWINPTWYVIFLTTGADSILPYNMPYTITVNVNALSDTNGNKATWYNYGYIASIPNAVATFKTVGQATQDFTPLGYSSLSGTATTELRVNFNDSLDMSTINSTNVKLYRVSGLPADTIIVEAISTTLFTQPDDISSMRFRASLTNAPTGYYYRLYLSRNIMDNAGNKLDGIVNGQPNGIGGEAGDAQWGIGSDDVNVVFYH